MQKTQKLSIALVAWVAVAAVVALFGGIFAPHQLATALGSALPAYMIGAVLFFRNLSAKYHVIAAIGCWLLTFVMAILLEFPLGQRFGLINGLAAVISAPISLLAVREYSLSRSRDVAVQPDQNGE